MKKLFKVAFSDAGDLLDHFWASRKSEDAIDFDDELEFVRISDYYKGAAKIWFKSINTGRQYCMFSKDFADAIAAKQFNHNKIIGKFGFVKKGTSQGIKLILENNP